MGFEDGSALGARPSVKIRLDQFEIRSGSLLVTALPDSLKRLSESDIPETSLC